VIEIKVDKDKEYSFLVLFFFIIAFIIFIYWNLGSFSGAGGVTGMVTSELTPNASTYLTNSLVGGTFTLILKQDDAIPDGVAVSVKLLGTGDSVADSWTGNTLSAFIVLSGKTYTTSSDTQFVDVDTPVGSPAPWEYESSPLCIGTAFKTADTYTFNLKDFDLKTSTPGDYNVTINATYTCNGVESAVFGKRIQIQVRNENAPTFSPNLLSFTTMDGKNKFKVNNEVNCSVKITDSDKDNQTISYKIWGPTGSYNTPDYSGNNVICNSEDNTAFSNGKVCSVIWNVSIKKKGVWNCSFSTSDGWLSTEINLTNNLTMINSEPFLKANIPNQNITGNKSNAFDLDDYFTDPDDDILTFNFTGNSSLVFVVDSDNTIDVNRKGNFTGTENVSIFFRDGINTTRSNWFTITVGAGTNTSCTSNWTCGNWSDCLSGIKTRTCSDLNTCQATKLENQTCLTGAVCGNSVCESTAGETCSSCAIDCGACQERINITTGVGTGTGIESETTKTSKLMLTGIILGGLVGFILVIVLINYFLTREKKPVFNMESESKKEVTVKIEKETKQILPEERTTEKGNVSAVNISELRDYINKALSNKVPVATIKEELLKTGWKEKQITQEFDIITLENYIRTKMKQGLKKEDLVEMLKIKGWTKEQIEEAFKNIG